jgi:hypothetical protein
MHRYKAVAQILLILSCFNFVFTAPVAWEIYDPRGNVVVPVVMRSAAISKERRGSESEGPTPSSSSMPPPDGSTPLHGSSPSDGPAPSHGSLSPPGGPAALAVSSPPGGTASLPVGPASDQPAPQEYTAVTHDMLAPPPEAQVTRFEHWGKVAAAGVTLAAITGWLIWTNPYTHSRRTIDPEWYVSNPSHPSCRRLNIPNHKRLTYVIFLSSTAKGPQHPCP